MIPIISSNALKLWAWPHIRNGYGFIYYSEQIKAIAIEKC